MAVLGQILEALWAGMKLGFHAIFSMLPIYDQLSGIQDQMIAAAIGVPVAVVSIGGLIIGGVKLVKRFI